MKSTAGPSATAPGIELCSGRRPTITLSAERPTETANWLPVPDAPYLLGLRVYEGHDAVVDCTWFPPALVPQG